MTIDLNNQKISMGQTTQGFGENGIFLGYDGNDPKLSLTSDTNFLDWNGSTLSLKGDLNIEQSYYSYSAQNAGEVKATNLSTNLSPYSADHTTYFPITITTGTINTTQTTQE